MSDTSDYYNKDYVYDPNHGETDYYYKDYSYDTKDRETDTIDVAESVTSNVYWLKDQLHSIQQFVQGHVHIMPNNNVEQVANRQDFGAVFGIVESFASTATTFASANSVSSYP